MNQEQLRHSLYLILKDVAAQKVSIGKAQRRILRMVRRTAANEVSENLSVTLCSNCSERHSCETHCPAYLQAKEDQDER